MPVLTEARPSLTSFADMMCCAVFLVQIVKNMVSMDQKHVLMLVSHLVASQPNLDTLPSGVVKLLCKKQDTGSLLAGIQSKNARTGPFVRCLVQSLSQSLEKDLQRRLLLDLAQKVNLGCVFSSFLSGLSVSQQ